MSKALDIMKAAVASPSAPPALSLLTSDDKFKALKALEASLNKQFGVTTSLVRLDSKVGIPLPSIGGDLPTLDFDVIGTGGIPRGRLIEFYGPESSGKTTLALHYVAKEQARGGVCVYIDAEHALDPNYMKLLGVDVSKLVVAQPDSGEQALETAQAIVEARAADLIVIDSVAALVPQAELDGEMGDSVPYSTPIYIRHKGSSNVEIAQIGDLYGKGEESSGWYRKTQRLETLTHKGWAQLKGVQKKQNIAKKPIVYTKTAQGYVGTTEDHSLFVNGKEASPKELQLFDRVDVYEQPIERGLCNIASDELAWLLGFYVAEGTTPRSKTCHRFEVCNTNVLSLERCQSILRDVFSLSVDIRQASTPTDTRKSLYTLAAPADDRLGWFMQQCISDKSMTKQVPTFILNGNKDIKEAFLDGFWHGDGNHSSTGPRKFFNNSWLVIAGIKFINEVPTATLINTSRPEQLTLAESPIPHFKHNEIRRFYKGGIPEFLYDLETEAGTFVTAVGNIICHNSHIGLQARLMSQAMRKLRGKCAMHSIPIVFINQIREKVGVMFGSPEVTPGGRALKFYASLRLDIRKIGGDDGAIKSGDVLIGHRMKLTAKKNKVGAPLRKTEVDLIYGVGIDTQADLIEHAISVGAVQQSGAWFSFAHGKEEVRAQGKPKLKDLLRDDPAAMAVLQLEVTKARDAQQEAA